MLSGIIHRYILDYEIDIYTISDLKTEKISGVNYISVDVRPWKGFLLRNLWILLILPKIHKKIAIEINKNYDRIFITHDYFTKSPFLLRYLKIESIYICQEPPREFYEPWEIHSSSLKEIIANLLRVPIKIIDKENITYAGRIICNSKYSQQVIKNVYDRDSEVIYPGIDEKYFCPDRNIRRKSILCIGGINPVKDQLFLVKSLKTILGKYKLILVGNGKKDYIEKIYVANGGNQNIEIISDVSDSKLRKLYREASVTCITANREPFGLSSIESQSCGTPVVAVAEGGCLETVIDGQTGYLSHRNYNEFLSKVLVSISLCDKLGKNARKNAIKNWGWNKTLVNLDKYIR